MHFKNLFFAATALLSVATLAAPANATKTMSTNEATFNSIRNVEHYSFKLHGLDIKAPIYKQDGVTFTSPFNVIATSNVYGKNTSYLATNAGDFVGSKIFGTTPVTITYAGPVLGLTLGSIFGAQTIDYIFNGVRSTITVPGDGKTTFLGLDTGAATGVSVTFFTLKELDIVAFASAAPEPATWAMMILGFGMVGLGLRRRQRSTAKVAFA